MNVAIGKYAVIELTPFTAPIAAILRQDEALTDVSTTSILPFSFPCREY